jgi:hypothetical protein
MEIRRVATGEKPLTRARRWKMNIHRKSGSHHKKRGFPIPFSLCLSALLLQAQE